MSTTVPQSSASESRAPALATQPVAVPRALGGRRLRKGHLALALVLIFGGGTLTSLSFYAVTNTSPYLVLTRRVPAGQTLTNADLGVVQINRPAGLGAVASGQRRTMIGRRTAVTLLPGQLLIREDLTTTTILQPGQHQIGVKLQPGQLPADRLYPGDAVLLIATPSKTATTTTSSSSTGRGSLGRWEATVVASSGVSGSDGSTVLYLAVADADTADLAALASAGELVVALAGTR